MIKLERIKKRYPGSVEHSWALRGVDHEILEGEFVAIMGASGSGKTTLLNLIGGLDREFEGSLNFSGKSLHDFSDTELSQYRNQKIGFVFQHFNLLDHMTVLENITLPACLSKVKLEFNPWIRAEELLDQLGLTGLGDQTPAQLSGGQKQRVAIARALLFKPKLLLCDEPTGSLDTDTGEQILNLFKGLHAQGYTMLMITHEARVAQTAERVITLKDGQIIGEEAPI